MKQLGFGKPGFAQISALMQAAACCFPWIVQRVILEWREGGLISVFIGKRIDYQGVQAR